MANQHVSHGEVKSIVDGLECSPSKSQASSKIYNPGAEPHAAKHGAKHKASATGKGEKGFGASRRTATKHVPKHV